MKPVWLPLEHHLNQELKKLPAGAKKFLISLSGGADSTALATAFFRVGKAHELNLRVVHFHHGDRVNGEFRGRSEKFVRKLAEEKSWDLTVIKNEEETLQSEEELRNFRRQGLRSILKPHEIIALGHHVDDLLETRLMRLLRGTGPQGLAAMRSFVGNQFRPWLHISRSEIEKYLQELNQDYLHDPFQDDLRSWLRKTWMPLLEERLPGATNSLARSLDNISEVLQNEQFPNDLLEGGGVFLPRFIALPVEQQRRALAAHLLARGIRNFTRSHIDEVLKHLDQNQVEYKFHLAQVEWSVNAQQISATLRVK